jgi:hypothetical protein
MLACSKPAPRWLLREVDDLAARLRVRPPETLVAPRIDSPFVWGFVRPKLLWPASLLGGMSPQCRRTVLAHELAHVRRRDHWVGWWQMFAVWIWWWNPLCWYVCRQLRINAELACDAWVVSLLPADRRAYAEALIDVTHLVSLRAMPVPALGMGSARQAFERRLTMIMRDRVPCRVPRLGLIGIGLLVLLVLPCWSQQHAPKSDLPRRQEGTPDKAELFQDLIVDVVGETAFVQSTSDVDRIKKLRDVEDKIQRLLEEVRALRAAASDGQRKSITVTAQPVVPMQQTVQARVQTVPPGGVKVLRFPEGSRDGDSITLLTRKTYRLSEAKARALGDFLRDQVSAKVMETKVDGDTLTVTTTPEAQGIIGQFVSLMQGKISFRIHERGKADQPDQIHQKGEAGHDIQVWQLEPVMYEFKSGKPDQPKADPQPKRP